MSFKNKIMSLFLFIAVTGINAMNDWTATASDGKTYSFFEMLDSGKHVVLQITRNS